MYHADVLVFTSRHAAAFGTSVWDPLCAKHMFCCMGLLCSPLLKLLCPPLQLLT
jgi:hypothetical protein